MTVTGVAHGGYCVGRLATGKVAMIRGALPGERLRVVVTSQRSKVAYGRVAEVLCPSPDRVAHIWPEGDTLDLGGVELGHVAPSRQLSWKREVLQTALQRNGSDNLVKQIQESVGDWFVQRPAGVSSEAAASRGHRTRVSFTVSPRGDLGMFQAASKTLHPVKTMPLMVPVLQESGWLRPGLVHRKLGLAPGNRVRFVAPSGSAPVIFSQGDVFTTEFLPESARVRERVSAGGFTHSFRIYAGSFWQTDQEAPATLAGALLDSVGDISGWEVVELYSGSGLFSLFLASAIGAKGRLLTVEGDGPAVKSAQYNLKNAGFSKAEVRRANVNASLVRSLEMGEKYSAGTLLVADPPRSGLGRDIVAAICEKEPLRIGLFSCDPVSCARDLELLRSGGYRVIDFRAFDLFTHTFHLESWALLERI